MELRVFFSFGSAASMVDSASVPLWLLGWQVHQSAEVSVDVLHATRRGVWALVCCAPPFIPKSFNIALRPMVDIWDIELLSLAATSFIFFCVIICRY